MNQIPARVILPASQTPQFYVNTLQPIHFAPYAHAGFSNAAPLGQLFLQQPIFSMTSEGTSSYPIASLIKER